MLGFQENIDMGSMGEDTDNMKTEEVITKYNDTNPESTKAIQEKALYVWKISHSSVV
jgi:hypothetical protein